VASSDSGARVRGSCHLAYRCIDAGCAGCSSVADGIADLGLLHARDITFAMASPAPQANLRRYAERMGRTDLPWYTISTASFSADFGVALTPYGGQSDDEDAPEGRPQAPQSFWYRRHDEFDEPPPSARGDNAQ